MIQKNPKKVTLKLSNIIFISLFSATTLIAQNCISLKGEVWTKKGRDSSYKFKGNELDSFCGQKGIWYFKAKHSNYYQKKRNQYPFLFFEKQNTLDTLLNPISLKNFNACKKNILVLVKIINADTIVSDIFINVPQIIVNFEGQECMKYLSYYIYDIKYKNLCLNECYFDSLISTNSFEMINTYLIHAKFNIVVYSNLAKFEFGDAEEQKLVQIKVEPY